MPEASSEPSFFRRRAPELALLVIASAVFLGGLGAMELWGKREQRATAEALDTVEHGNWLIANIQSRPRLEKPPLPRWTIATLMKATGVQDEWIVRLPSALTAVAMVGLVYGLGRRMAGRSVGLASGLALASMLFFVVESRQAGNDGPLAFFTTLALYAAFRRLHGVSPDEPCGVPGDVLGGKGWAFLMWAAMGLGFLSKGPVSLLLPAIAILPYLAMAKRFKVGTRALASGWGVLACLGLILCWPVPVLLNRPEAYDIWMLEIGQKAGSAGITHHKQRYFVLEWPWMTAPWTLLATWAVALPFFKRGQQERPTVWLPWSWAVGNFAMFCLWSVAKPNYYVPCEPGVALLVGLAWVRLAGVARANLGAISWRANALLRIHWGILAALALAAPIAAMVYAKDLAPGLAERILPWSVVASAAIALAVALSIRSWRRGDDAGSLAALVGGLSVGMLIVYAELAPALNATRSHRALAYKLASVIPPDVDKVMFYRELDEGLWFYLKGHTLKPVPGTTPEINKAFDYLKAHKENRLVLNKAERIRLERQVLIDWLNGDKHESPYVLIRAEVYDMFNPGLAELVEPIYREKDMERNELMLVKVKDRSRLAAKPPEGLR